MARVEKPSFVVSPFTANLLAADGLENATRLQHEGVECAGPKF